MSEFFALEIGDVMHLDSPGSITFRDRRGDRLLVEVTTAERGSERASERQQRLIDLLQRQPALLDRLRDHALRLFEIAGRQKIPPRGAWESLRAEIMSERAGATIPNDLAALAARLAIVRHPELAGVLKLGKLADSDADARLLTAAHERGII